MATKVVGTLGIGPFDAASSKWTSYAERMEEAFLANDVTEDRQKVAFLLSTVGSETYDLHVLHDLCSPEKPNTKAFKELVETLQNHLQPQPTTIAERYRMHQRNQESGESVSEYLAALRRLAKDCHYEGLLNEALRDSFFCGLASDSMRRRLFLEKDLTLEKATELALAMEAADKDAMTMQAQKQSVNAVYRHQEKRYKNDTKPV